MKSGYYTEYEGKEYRLAQEKGMFFLISEDDSDVQKGFVKLANPYDSRKLYEKKISIEEINKVEYIYTVAIYQGMRVGIESSTKDTVLLATSDKIFYEKYGFEEVDRNVYMKDVPFDEVELVEGREPARYIESAKTFV